MTCPSQPRQKLRPCGDVEATAGPANGQTLFFPLFSAPASASGSHTPAAVAGPAVPSIVPSGLSSVVLGEKAGCSRARMPSEAHMVLYRERMRRS